jgi:hypothetical protein
MQLLIERIFGFVFLLVGFSHLLQPEPWVEDGDKSIYSPKLYHWRDNTDHCFAAVTADTWIF